MANDTVITVDPLVVARFWSKVKVGRPNVCWPWNTTATNEHGYGIFKPRKGEAVVKAHRFAWSLANGPIPADAIIMHSCDNPPCCNPAHLAVGTQADNVADMHGKGRREYRSKLTSADLHDIRARCADGEPHDSVAADYQITKSYVSMLAAGKRGTSIRKAA